MSKQQIPVSRRAITQRINRKLAQVGERLMVARGERAKSELGDYYTLNVVRNFLVNKNINLEDLAKSLGVLRPYETIEA